MNGINQLTPLETFCKLTVAERETLVYLWRRDGCGDVTIGELPLSDTELCLSNLVEVEGETWLEYEAGHAVAPYCIPDEPLVCLSAKGERIIRAMTEARREPMHHPLCPPKEYPHDAPGAFPLNAQRNLWRQRQALLWAEMMEIRDCFVDDDGHGVESIHYVEGTEDDEGLPLWIVEAFNFTTKASRWHVIYRVSESDDAGRVDYLEYEALCETESAALIAVGYHLIAEVEMV